MEEATGPRKVRWTVPAIDISVSRWLDAQVSISNSLSALIRDSIERDGYVDVVHRPVEQLPRRGRPPGGADEYNGRSPQGQIARQSAEAPEPLHTGVGASEPQEQRFDAAIAANDSQPRAATAKEVIETPMPEVVDDPGVKELEPAPAPTQMDMNAIFGHGS